MLHGVARRRARDRLEKAGLLASADVPMSQEEMSATWVMHLSSRSVRFNMSLLITGSARFVSSRYGVFVVLDCLHLALVQALGSLCGVT